jgi:integrase
MTAAPLFVDFARVVLDRREREGIRGIYHERNRFSVHVEGAAFAAMPLDAIRPRDLRAWIREMQDKIAQGTDHTLADDTVKRAFSLVSSVFTVAIEDDILEMDPSHAVKVKKRVTERSTREKWTVLSLDEQKLLAKCDAIPVADRLAIRFAVATGLRQGEQFALELRDLHLGVESPHVFVRFGKPGLPPKSGKTRRVPLMADGLVAAKEWSYLLGDFAPSNPHSLVFPTISVTRSAATSSRVCSAGAGRSRRSARLLAIARLPLLSGTRTWTSASSRALPARPPSRTGPRSRIAKRRPTPNATSPRGTASTRTNSRRWRREEGRSRW